MENYTKQGESPPSDRWGGASSIDAIPETGTTQARDHDSVPPRPLHTERQGDVVNPEELPQTQHSQAIEHDISSIISSYAQTCQGPVGVEEVSYITHGQRPVHPSASSLPASQPPPRPRYPSQQPMIFPQSFQLPVIPAAEVASPLSSRKDNILGCPRHFPHDKASNTSPAEKRRTSRKQYRPFALRWPFLIALLLSLFILAGLLAVSLHVLPNSHTDSLGQMAKRGSTDEHHSRSPSPTILLSTFARYDNRRLAPSISNYSETATSTTSISAAESMRPVSGNDIPGHSVPKPVPSDGTITAVTSNGFLGLGTNTVMVHHRSSLGDEATQTTDTERSSNDSAADSGFHGSLKQEMTTFISPLPDQPEDPDHGSQEATTIMLPRASSGHSVPAYSDKFSRTQQTTGTALGVDQEVHPEGFIQLRPTTLYIPKGLAKKTEVAWVLPSSDRATFEQTTKTTTHGHWEAISTAGPQATASPSIPAVSGLSLFGKEKSKNNTNNNDPYGNTVEGGIGPGAFIPLGRITVIDANILSKKTVAAPALPNSAPNTSGETTQTTSDVPTPVAFSRLFAVSNVPPDLAAAKGWFVKLGPNTIMIHHKLGIRSETIGSPASISTVPEGTTRTTTVEATDVSTSDFCVSDPQCGESEDSVHVEEFISIGEQTLIIHKLAARTEADALPSSLSTISAVATPATSSSSKNGSPHDSSLPILDCDDVGGCETNWMPGHGRGGFIPIGKHTATFIRKMVKRTDVHVVDRPIATATTVSKEVPIKVIPTMAPTTVTKSHYPLLNQSTTTHKGKHIVPTSSHRPTQHSVSTARPPLNTTRPAPQTTTTQVTVEVIDLEMGQYFVCFFLPTLLCTLLAIPVRLVDQSVRLLQPFHELANHNGATGRDSLWLETAGWRCRVASLRHMFSSKQSLVLLTGVLQVLTWILVSFSATAVGLQLVGDCRQGDPYSVANNCGMTPAVFLRPTIIMLSILGTMAIILAVIMARLTHWDTGVDQDPWTISAQARLSRSKDLRSRMHLATPRTNSESEAQSEKFSLSYFENENKSARSFGVIPLGPNPLAPSTRSLPASILTFLLASSTWINEKSRTMMRTKERSDEKENLEVPFTLGYTGRALFLVFMCGLMVVILYYHNVDTPSPFENFMDDESYGVTLLFTGVGAITTEFWSSFSEDIALISPYHCLATSNTASAASLLTSRPTHALSGVWIALRRRHWFLLLVSLTSIPAEFLPIFLSNIPYNMTQLYLVYVDCYYISIAILSLMVALVVASFFLRWTKLPASPLTLAGAMYYVVDSNSLGELADDGIDDDDAEGLQTRASMPKLFKGATVEFGLVPGVSGNVRTQVEITNLNV